MPGEWADVDRPQASVRDELRDLLLCAVVVAGDQDVELLALDLPARSVGAKVVLNAFTTGVP